MSRLQQRLTRQLASRGVKDASQMANALLIQRGHLKDGKLTAEGKQRQSLGAEGRAKDRAVKRSGGSPSDYKYNPKTNQTRKK